MKRCILALVVAIGIAFVPGCGGGGGTSSSGNPPTTPTGSPNSPAIQITTGQILPAALRNRAYTTTLQAINTQGTVQWSASLGCQTCATLAQMGLSLDATTGVVSGTPTLSGTNAFTAQVTDSAGRSATKTFNVTVSEALSAPATYNRTLSLYQQSSIVSPPFGGGIPPYTLAYQGTIPPGLRFNAQTNRLEGTPLATGTYPLSLTIRDSYPNPESVTQQLTVTVIPAPLQFVSNSLPPHIPINVPFSGFAVVRGGTPPYSFSLTGGAPPGLGLDMSTGRLSGTPMQTGTYGVQIHVQDSTQPVAQTADSAYGITVGAALSRNDSVQTATPLGNGSFQATLSPYIDPPNHAPLPADNDYYKLVSVAGSVVGVRTSAKEFTPYVPTDTVLEIVDANGVRLNGCRQLGSNAAFTSPCINDDTSTSLQDSSLEVKMPGGSSQQSTVYAHVLDWRGMARPDFTYFLVIGGIITPMTIPAQTVKPGTINKPHFYQLTVNNPQGAVTWSILSGSLPPGITMTSTGFISGTATALGTYPFTVQVTDSLSPAQVVTADLQMQVVDLLTVTSPATWPDACVNQPYSFTMTASGGIPPYYFSLNSQMWPALHMNENTGTVTGTAAGLDTPGTFTAFILVSDRTENGVIQTVQVTVKDCP